MPTGHIHIEVIPGECEAMRRIGEAMGLFDMPGKGHRFTGKQDRQAAHVAASERARGKSSAEAKRIGYATVVSQGGGRKKSARKR